MRNVFSGKQDHDAARPMASWRTWAFALALWLLVAAATSFSLWQLHHTALKSEARELDLLSRALTDELDRGLRSAEEGLQALDLELHEHRLPIGGDTAQALQTRVALMPLITSIWLLGEDRNLVASSQATPVPDLHTFQPPLESLSPKGIAWSRAYMPEGESQPQVAIAYRAGSGHGQPIRWIVSAIPASNLLGAFDAALPAPGARMAIFRSDGTTLAGVNTGPLDASSAALATQAGVALSRFSDGSDNLVGSHRIPRYGLAVVVSRELGAVLEGWRGALRLSLGALAFLLVTMGVAAYIVTNAARQRLAAQHALQVQRARTSRLEALGALAGGVSHDFNNVLAGIVGYGEMARDAASPGSPQARHLDRVLQAAGRGRLLIERILAFSRGGARTSTVFEVEPVVDEVLTLLTASLRPDVVLERAFAAPGARLRGDVTQIFEVVMNLCTNAMQAMPDGGMLSVQVERRRVLTTEVLSHSQLPAGDYLALCVADQGVGITPDVMEHLFEPFFSARSAQGGTGLGLAVVFGVVGEFGGGIDVDSQPGQGARFTLYLPECTDPLPEQDRTDETAPAGAGQCLLLVDDETPLLAMTSELLTKLGYESVCVTNASDALRAVAEEPGRFAAVITDESMPGLSGTQLANALREQAPDLPVLLVSGYGGAQLAHRADSAGVRQVLSKPLQRAELARALARLFH